MSVDERTRAEINQMINAFLEALHRTLRSSKTTDEQGAHRWSVPLNNGVGQSGSATLVPNELKGYSFRETTGNAAAVIELLDGNDANGEVVVTISLAANESTRDWFSETGIALTNGLYVNIVSGQIKGAVYTRRGGVS